MKNFFKGKIGTILILLATLILAGVAVFTAIRLYQLRSQPVAPNVPASIPRAAETTTCSLSFTLTPTSTAVVCTSKTAYKDVATNTAGNYDISTTNLLAANATVNVGQRIVYVVSPGPTNVTKTITITDTLPTNVTFVDSDSVCTYASATRKVTCTLPDTDSQVAFRVSVNTGATGTITNTASVQGTGDAASTCSVSVVVPIPQCNSACTNTNQCSSGLVCNIPAGSTAGNCRNATCTSEASCVCATATPTPTPTPTVTPTSTPNSCNGTCGSNSNCASNLICSNGFCRNPSCTISSNCVCSGTPGPTATPVPTLPQSGTDWPTVAGFGVGIFVILGSLLLAL